MAFKNRHMSRPMSEPLSNFKSRNLSQNSFPRWEIHFRETSQKSAMFSWRYWSVVGDWSGAMDGAILRFWSEEHGAVLHSKSLGPGAKSQYVGTLFGRRTFFRRHATHSSWQAMFVVFVLVCVSIWKDAIDMMKELIIINIPKNHS